jgi:hypothetical protein
MESVGFEEKAIEGGYMKALAIRQPWAWLIIKGIKDVENRTWSTNFRRQFLVHASQTMAETPSWVNACLSRKGIAVPEDLPRGGIVGVATLVDCVHHAEISWWARLLRRLLCRRSLTGGSAPANSIWFDGPYGFILEDARPLPFVPLRGQLNFFDVPDDLYGAELEP